MKKLVRMTAKLIDRSQNDLLDGSLVFMLVLEDQKMVNQETYGHELLDGKIYPFILRNPDSTDTTSQRLTYSENEEVNDSTTNLFTKEITIDEYFTVIEEDVAYTYQITNLVEIM